MALSSTVLIATSGVINGKGFQINAPMVTNIMSVMTSEMIVNVGNIIALSNTFSNLQPIVANIPYVLTNANTVGQAVFARANSIILNSSVYSNKNYVYLLGKSADFISLAQQYTAAIDEMSHKSFGDFGIGVTNYVGTTTDSVTTLIPMVSTGYSNLVKYIASLPGGDPLSKVPGMDPTVVGPQIVKNILGTIADILRSLGSLYDFTDLTTFGYAVNMLKMLQAQGLADSTGINNYLINAGYNPYDYTNLIEVEIMAALSQVTGSNLSKIIALTGTAPLKQPTTLTDLLNVDFYFPSYLQEVLNIQNTGIQGMKTIGNRLLNIGAGNTADKIIAVVATMEVPNSPIMNSLNTPLPQPVVNELRPLFGQGVGLFQEPTISDILGTAAGEVHSDAFANVYSQVVNITNAIEGQWLLTNIGNVIHYVTTSNSVMTDSNVTHALQSLSNTVYYLNNSTTSSVVDAIKYGNVELNACLDRLVFEANNAALAGFEFLASGQPNLSSGINDLLSFCNNLQNYGNDLELVGYNYMLTRTTTSDQTGDAIRSSLVEGRNLARSSIVGQAVHSQPDQSVHRRAAANVALAPATTAVTQAATSYDNTVRSAVSNLDATKIPSLISAVEQSLASLQDKQDSLRGLAALGSGSPLV